MNRLGVHKDTVVAGGDNSCNSHYSDIQIFDDVSPLAIKARLLVEEVICNSHRQAVAAFPTTTPAPVQATTANNTIKDMSSAFIYFIGKQTDDTEKGKKRKQRNEDKLKYCLVGSKIVSGTYSNKIELATLTDEFEKFLNKASTTNLKEQLQKGLKSKIRTMKDEKKRNKLHY